MGSLARHHRNRVKKEGYVPIPDKSYTPPAPTAGVSKTNQFSERLKLDRMHIDSIQDFEKKDAFKKSRLPIYRDYVTQYLRSDKTQPNQVVSWYLVWLIDVGEVESFSVLCPLAINKGQRCPEGFRRTLAEFFHDELGRWVKHEFEKGRNGKRPFLDRSLVRLLKKDPIDKINPIPVSKNLVLNAKLLLHFEQQKPESIKEAIASCYRALEVYPKTRVKILLENLEKIKKTQHPAGRAGDPQVVPN